jgi:hypothetical protein
MKTRFDVGDRVYWMCWNKITTGVIDAISTEGKDIVYHVAQFRMYEKELFSTYDELLDDLKETFVKIQPKK